MKHILIFTTLMLSLACPCLSPADEPLASAPTLQSQPTLSPGLPASSFNPAEFNLDSAGNSFSGMSELPAGSSSLSTGGTPASIPDAVFAPGPALQPSSPSSVPSDFVR